MEEKYREVIDMESDNQCDECGVLITIGQIYFALDDDRDILCVICMSKKDNEEESKV